MKKTYKDFIAEAGTYWKVTFKSNHKSVEVKAKNAAEADKKGISLAAQQKGTGDPVSDKVTKLPS